jgi:hypothetical protein
VLLLPAAAGAPVVVGRSTGRVTVRVPAWEGRNPVVRYRLQARAAPPPARTLRSVALRFYAYTVRSRSRPLFLTPPHPFPLSPLPPQVRTAPLPLRWAGPGDQPAYDTLAAALAAAAWRDAGEVDAPPPAAGERIPPPATADVSGLAAWSRVEVRAAALGAGGRWGPYGEPGAGATLPTPPADAFVAGVGAERVAVAWTPTAGAQLRYRVAVWAWRDDGVGGGAWVRGADSVKAGPPADRHDVTGLDKVAAPRRTAQCRAAPPPLPVRHSPRLR